MHAHGGQGHGGWHASRVSVIARVGCALLRGSGRLLVWLLCVGWGRAGGGGKKGLPYIEACKRANREQQQ